MDSEFERRITDYFTSTELVDLLDIPIEELLPLIEEYILEKKEDIDDFINYGS